MALPQRDLPHLLESFRTAAGLELVRHPTERLLQELIEAEARVSTEWRKHTESRTTWHTGTPRET